MERVDRLNFCLRILCTVGITLTLAVDPAGAQRVAVPSVFKGDTRLDTPVSLDGSAHILSEAVKELGKKAKLGLDVTPEMRDYPTLAVGRERPAVEYLEGIGMATGGRWRKKDGGYRLEFRGSSFPSLLQVERRPELQKVKLLERIIRWPAPVPPARSGAASPSGPPLYESTDSFRRALFGVARDCGVALIAQGPVLGRSYNPRAAPGDSDPTALETLRAVERRTGGKWSRIGGTYALLLPEEDLAFQRLPEAERRRIGGERVTALYKSLTPGQIAVLRQGGRIGYAEMRPEQQALFRAAASAHHAYTPFYDRSAATRPNGWHFAGIPSGIDIRLDHERRIATKEWQYIH